MCLKNEEHLLIGDGERVGSYTVEVGFPFESMMRLLFVSGVDCLLAQQIVHAVVQ